jgi:hypothetical protein
MSPTNGGPELFFELGVAAELTRRALGYESDSDDHNRCDGVSTETDPSRTSS